MSPPQHLPPPSNWQVAIAEAIVITIAISIVAIAWQQQKHYIYRCIYMYMDTTKSKPAWSECYLYQRGKMNSPTRVGSGVCSPNPQLICLRRSATGGWVHQRKPRSRKKMPPLARKAARFTHIGFTQNNKASSQLNNISQKVTGNVYAMRFYLKTSSENQ